MFNIMIFLFELRTLEIHRMLLTGVPLTGRLALRKSRQSLTIDMCAQFQNDLFSVTHVLPSKQPTLLTRKAKWAGVHSLWIAHWVHGCSNHILSVTYPEYNRCRLFVVMLTYEPFPNNAELKSKKRLVNKKKGNKLSKKRNVPFSGLCLSKIICKNPNNFTDLHCKAFKHCFPCLFNEP